MLADILYGNSKIANIMYRGTLEIISSNVNWDLNTIWAS